MAFLLRVLKWILRGFALAIVLAASWLYVSPPDLIRGAANYAAKMVCSNVFLASRDSEDVLLNDVRPSHWIMDYMRVSVDESAGTVRSGLVGLFGKGLAVYRPGLGCTSVPDGDFARAQTVRLGIQNAAPQNADAVWPTGDLVEPSQNPEVSAILDDKSLQGPGMRAIVVVQNGRVVGERYGDGFSHTTALLGWSMSKTVTAAVIGTLVRDGKLSMSQSELFPEWKTDARKDIALADLMAMSSALEFNEEYGDISDVTRMLFLEPSGAAFARDKPLTGEIGKVFNYSSGTTVLLSRIWQNALGDEAAALSYPQQALFGPLGMTSAVLEADETGTFIGSSYLYATARDWVRFGAMLANGGSFNGAQILPAGFVNIMRTPIAASDTGFGPQYTQGQMWLRGPSGGAADDVDPDLGFALPNDAIWLRGHDGQSMCIIPSRQMVVLRMGYTPSKLGYKSQPLVQRLLAVLP
jgi:CubicO group peptidase (beta-lactamase class C family)